ncbi:oligosaccharide flippase family protein [Paucibacter sp. XJ19-41]|uniref:oligosaccharide flippase family protein n=1 Tax=Paucibacter sp. XJ19-41 TaxID=2927824 RepID=UPI002349FF2D|nr:oligosaccharide flippase family protein [Paucibacter sp. XJ19-41]MDC6166175.1 oligosaccharide flippase family protein [Paucibacter sp. XJ19-41]
MSESHRQIFKSTSITGGASAITLLAGMGKIKVLALLGGPVAVGVMGLLQNVLTATATVAGCGLASSGIRAIAAHADEPARVAALWKSLLWASLALGFGAGLALVLAGDELGALLLGRRLSTEECLLLSLGVIATLLFTTHTALLQGLRRIGDLAIVNITASVVGAMTSLVPIYLELPHAVLWFVVIAPVTSALFAYVALRWRRLLPQDSVPDAAAISELGHLFKLGIPIMAASAVTLGTQLAARALIANRLGLEASGHFQAAWSISTTYIGFILSAMAADYFPRLSAMSDRPKEAAKLVNQQAEMALTMAAPFVLAIIAFSPQAITALYSSKFTGAFDLLRWQALGDILKILCWPIGYILLSTGRGKLFIAAEAIWSITYLGLMYLFIDQMKLNIAGIGFVGAYVVLLLYLTLSGKLLINYLISARNFLFMIALLIIGVVIIQTTTIGNAVYLHATLVLVVALYTLWRLDQLVNLRELIRNRLARL